MKNLLTLYLKHDSSFKQYSKIALIELVLKILYFEPNGLTIKQLANKIAEVTNAKVDQAELNSIIGSITIKIKNGCFCLTDERRAAIEDAIKESDKLHLNVIHKYFGGSTVDNGIVQEWFQNATVLFFDRYSFQWMHNMRSRDKKSLEFQDAESVILDSFDYFDSFDIGEDDKRWLIDKYVRFLNESDFEADQLFWQYGLSAFSARLINAKNFANKINIDAFRDYTFVLDTNVLMILGLDAHDLNGSIVQLEQVLQQLNIKLEYLHITQEEYRNAIAWRRDEIKRVFDNYDESVLFKSDCPFIRTALSRRCCTASDIDVLFDEIEQVPDTLSDSLPISICDDSEIANYIEEHKESSTVKTKLNSIYAKFKNHDKREPALIHDAGLLAAVDFLRSKKIKCSVLTNDAVMKKYSIENPIRDEVGVAVGIDALISMFAVGAGTTKIDPSHFAPLFKNLVKLSLYPSKEAFQTSDLSFMLDVNLEIQKLSPEKVIEIAKTVNQKLANNEGNDSVGLYLRREIEKERLANISQSEASAHDKELLQSEIQRKEVALTSMGEMYRKSRFEELYGKARRTKRWYIIGFILTWLLVCCIVVLIMLKINCETVNALLLIVPMIASYFPANRYLFAKIDRKKIHKQIDEEIKEKQLL